MSMSLGFKKDSNHCPENNLQNNLQLPICPCQAVSASSAKEQNIKCLKKSLKIPRILSHDLYVNLFIDNKVHEFSIGVCTNEIMEVHRPSLLEHVLYKKKKI